MCVVEYHRAYQRETTVQRTLLANSYEREQSMVMGRLDQRRLGMAFPEFPPLSGRKVGEMDRFRIQHN